MVKQTNYSPEEFRRLLFDDVVNDMRSTRNFDKNDIKAVKQYFKSGDLEKYLASGCKIQPNFVLFLFPKPTFDEVISRLKIYWDWVLDDKANRLNDEHKNFASLDEYFMRVFGFLFDYQYGNHYSNELIADVFHWAYGPTYDPEWQFPITFGPDDWRPHVSVNVNEMGTRLINGLDNCCFSDQQSQYYNDSRYAHFVDYCLSLFPLLDTDCYATKYFDRRHKENGKRTGKRTYQHRMRGFLCHMNGIAPQEEDDVGIKYPDLIINTPEVVEKLRDGIAKLELPDEYHKLIKFILKHGTKAMEIDK